MRFFRFFEKNLKVKNAYLGAFSVKNEKQNMYLETQRKVCFKKVPLLFLRGLRKKVKRKSLFFFGVPLGGQTPQGKHPPKNVTVNTHPYKHVLFKSAFISGLFSRPLFEPYMEIVVNLQVSFLFGNFQK